MAARKTSIQSSDNGCLSSKDTIQESLDRATEICSKRGVRLTPSRREILELLLRRNRPTGAYELIDDLSNKSGRPIGPPTVYRALDFLKSQGLVSKVESQNAYIPCAHPDHDHDCIFFICAKCGTSFELEDPGIERRLAEEARQLQFSVTSRMIEVQGVCADCVVPNNG
ncbi:MAG: Fur family transcriptional regulator [Pseudomonadota bacterium]